MCAVDGQIPADTIDNPRCVNVVSQEGLYSHAGLERLDRLFLNAVKKHSFTLFEQLIGARSKGVGSSEIIIELAYVLEQFIAQLFGIEAEMGRDWELHTKSLALHKCKRTFVHRYALKKYGSPEGLNLTTITDALSEFFSIPVEEYSFAQQVNLWLEEPEKYELQLDVAAKYAAYMVHLGSESTLFRVPSKTDFNNLIPVNTVQKFGLNLITAKTFTAREGFNIAKPPSSERALSEVHYCITCHKQKRDSCSKGIVDKLGNVKASELGIPMGGCPVRVKVSEAILLRAQGLIVAPLAVVVVDNPMCVLTGHRICNDCMRSCIYQKQQPVDVPYIETHILDSVLNLSYGFEIYSLFTRWNPLSFTNVLPKHSTGKNVLVVGLGPAGIGLSHYLLNEGHNVVAIDGLKIEALPERLSGITATNQKCNFDLVKDAKSELFENLDDRPSYGFGGVSEYGITARWNKNYLKVARLLLERRKNFAMYGGVRLGGTIDVEDAFAMGFHHIALATGAGSPRIPQMGNMLAKGVMTASAFLMSLHLGNATQFSSLTNLQIRLPAVVIGGGLTAVDAATELLAYYPVQVEHFLLKYEALVKKLGKDAVEGSWGEEERAIAHEFLSHAREIRSERTKAQQEKRQPDFLPLLQAWGGVTIIYRKSLNSSIAYKLNSAELEHALSEGVYFAESMQPSEIMLDEYGHVSNIAVKDAEGKEQYIAARSAIIAVGTHEGHHVLEERNILFRPTKDAVCNQAGHHLETASLDERSFFISRDKTISAFGDLHPYYKGSVVKALASAKNGYQLVTQALEGCPKHCSGEMFLESVRGCFLSRITAVTYPARNIVELTIHSPIAARKFKPGQFYRLQNFGSTHPYAKHTQLLMEGVAVTGASVDKENGTITVVVLDVGGSSKLCSQLRDGQLVSLMGPVGTPTEIPSDENVMLVGGGVGNAVLFAVGKALIANGCKVLYFAGYRSLESVFGIRSIEAASHTTVWCCEDGAIKHERPEDISHHGNIIDAIQAYSAAKNSTIKLQSVDRIIMVGSSGMMSAISSAVRGKLRSCFKEQIKIVASINSPMQCMMGGICGQCIQRHINPSTGEESFVYSCVNQDQCANAVDFEFLRSRLQQNSVLERCTSLWVDHHSERR
ncbi:FAD-dependent oxidoreductase [Anaplasma marginale]|uniref:FAD-dependent oxidoreductase n=1 Tax=Anaplasma marginale TaxID=770 RepID=UPI00123A7238|nr:FAD-dependent oxidoreductase [Anaplasma marginale]KAA8473135.1 glutamate synthase subunit beta [Anaplasma marginale]KAB0451495.1 glutamate synthase subunit beta [Anaplasma marginale]